MKKNKLDIVIHTDPFVGDLTLLDLCYFLQNIYNRQIKLQGDIEKLVESFNYDKTVVSNIFYNSKISDDLDTLDKILRDAL